MDPNLANNAPLLVLEILLSISTWCELLGVVILGDFTGRLRLLASNAVHRTQKQ